MITPKTTVRQIVGRYPQTRRVFEKHRIDYCCGGKLALEEAAKQVQANLQKMIGDLDTAIQTAPDERRPEERDWYTSPMPQLVAHILDVHHAYMHTALPKVRQLAEKVLRVHGPKHGDVLQPVARLYAALDSELTPLVRLLVACADYIAGAVSPQLQGHARRSLFSSGAAGGSPHKRGFTSDRQDGNAFGNRSA